MATIDIFNLSPRDFNLQMQEEAMYRTPAELDELRREYRNRNSMAGKLMGLLAPEEGKRRSTFLPVDAPQGMSIFDALRSGQATPAVPQGLVDLITGGTRGVESAREYAQGVPPRADALNDALAMSGLAMTGGGAIAGRGALEYDPTVTRIFAGPKAKTAGIRAYHGSPHSFDKFSMDKIGTGEGAQAYGHGLYFAENEAVADSYKQSIRRNSEELRRIAEREGGLSGDAAEMLSYQFSMDDFHGKGFDKWLQDLKKYRDDGMLPMRSKKAIDEIINRSVEASDAVRVMKNPGSMYEVNINANPDDFLDWDAPLSAQSQSVQDAFVGINAGDDALLREVLDTSPEGMMMQGMMPNAKGSAAYRTLMERGFEDGAVGLNLPAGNPMKPADKWASERLRKAGIPGIKYLDAGSRGTDAATRNFVVFDENLINIVKKYGIAGAATMLGVSAMDVEQAMAQGYQPSSQQPQGLLAQGAQ